MSDVPKIPNEVELVVGEAGKASKLYLDGVEFPWHITSDDLEIVSGIDQPTILHVGIIVERSSVRFASPEIFEPEDTRYEVGQILDRLPADPCNIVELMATGMSLNLLPYLMKEDNGWFWGKEHKTPHPSYGEHSWDYVISQWGDLRFKVTRILD